MALTSASAEFAAAALSAAAPVTNSAGEPFTSCTIAVVFNMSRAIENASPPPPPAIPPYSTALGGLDVLDFVNMSK